MIYITYLQDLLQIKLYLPGCGITSMCNRLSTLENAVRKILVKTLIIYCGISSAATKQDLLLLVTFVTHQHVKNILTS